MRQAGPAGSIILYVGQVVRRTVLDSYRTHSLLLARH
jgi:hypothetical protein